MPAFRHKVKEVILREHLIEENDLLIVAVSGGADSLSLLHVLNEIKLHGTVAFSLHVAHLNHGLRGKKAREDADFVRRVAAKMGLPCTIGEVNAETFRRRRGLSTEDAARRLRYRFLGQLAKRIAAASVAVGHNRDDQVETLLLNFLRGTGPDGLTGMRYSRKLGDDRVNLIRPLLEISREEINLYCREHDLAPRLDETNLDVRFKRNKIRLELLPYLEKEFNVNLRRALLRLSNILTLDRDYMEDAARKRLESIIFKEEPHCLALDAKALAGEHQALQGRILRQAVRRLLGGVPREIGHDHIRSMVNLCLEGAPHGMLHLPWGLRASRSYDNLMLYYREPLRPKVFTPFRIKVPGRADLPGTSMALAAEVVSPRELVWPPDREKEAYLDHDRVLQLAARSKAGKGQAGEGEEEGLVLTVRPRQPGDRFYPLGAPGKRKLKNYFINQKVPRGERDHVPLVVAGEEIIWVVGKQVSQLCRITERTERVLVFRLL